jgi:hypothetical protein
VRPISGREEFERHADFQRRLYVWTPQMSAGDAFDEGLRVISGWPPGTRLVSIVPAGVYRWQERQGES